MDSMSIGSLFLIWRAWKKTPRFRRIVCNKEITSNSVTHYFILNW